eukprot:2975014-Amphidinium_carterae.1
MEEARASVRTCCGAKPGPILSKRKFQAAETQLARLIAEAFKGGKRCCVIAVLTSPHWNCKDIAFLSSDSRNQDY